MSVVGKKLFVGNLSYDTSDAELAEAFAKYGEVKASFTVKSPGVTDKCKGYGYVVFKSKESCSKACAQVKVIKGRPVKVMLARSKKSHPLPDRDDHHDNDSSEESDYETKTAKKSENSKTLKKPKSERSEARFGIGKTLVLKKLPEDITEEQLTSFCEGVEGVTCVSVSSEGADINGLVTFDTHKNTKSALQKLSKLKKLKKVHISVLSKATKGVSQNTLRKSRLIVRNISFKCTEEDLSSVFSECGVKVVEVKIPHKENGHMFGFGFVQLVSYFDAAKAIKCVNGMSIKGRPVAVDWVVPKATYQQSLNKTTPTSGDNKQEEEVTIIDSKEQEDMSDEGSKERENDSSNDEGSKEEDNTSDGGSKEGENDATAESAECGRVSVTSDVGEGKTLFIRNLPMDTDYKQVMSLFGRFGPIRYVRVLLDQHTKLSKGSAFLQFKKQDSLEPCLLFANGDGLHCHGNKLVVSLAVPREQAEEFKGQNTKVKEDKRNLYLAKEGLILPESSAAEGLSKVDMARRRKAYAERKAKLSDPNYFVSRTRLSVRNLPTGVDEKMLRRVFTNAAQLSVATVSQVKIMRSSERVDGRGLGRSKGFGFIEFKGHEDALKALRCTNNNPELFGEKRRLIVEFSVENSRALNLRAQRKQRQVVQAKQSTADSAVTKETTEPSKRLKWRQKWQSRRLKRKANTSATDQTEDTKQQKKVNIEKKMKELPQEPARKETGKKRLNDIYKPPSKKAKRDNLDDTVLALKDTRRTGKRSYGNRSRRSKTDVEEIGLESMVNKYRIKLDKNLLSKWTN